MNKNWLSLLASLILVCFITYPQPAQRPAGPQVSEAEMQQLESELAEFQKELDAMSPEEQKAFYESMEAAVKRIDEMSKTEKGRERLERLEKGDISDEELDELLEDLMSPQEMPKQEAAPEVVPVKEKPKPQPKPVITDEQQKTIQDITDLIKATNAFLVKANSITDLPGMYGRWLKKKKISTAVATWSDFKIKIEQFVAQLEKLLKQNPKTKAYPHIEIAVKSRSFMNNLNNLKLMIEQNNQKIEPASLFEKKIKQDTKLAIQRSINKFDEALTVLNLPEDIKNILAGFEPEAKKLKEEEEAAQKKAEEESKRVRRPGYTITAGEEDTGYDQGYYPSYDDYNGSYYGGTPAYSPSYQAPYADSFTPGSSGAPSRKGEGKGEAGLKPGEKKDEKDSEKEDKEKFDAKEDEKGKSEETKSLSIPESAEVKKLMDRIKIQISDAAREIKESKNLQSIQQLVTGDQVVNLELVTQNIPDIMRLLSARKGALDAINTLQHKINPAFLGYYKEKLQDMFKDVKKDFEKVIKQLDELQTQWPQLQNTLSDEKLWAYFGYEKPVELPAQPEDQAVEEEAPAPVPVKQLPIKMQISSPVSLFDLNTTLKTVMQRIETFEKKDPSTSSRP